MSVNASDGTARWRDRFAKTVAVLAGALFVLFGAWAFVAPRSFFQTVALFEPYNRHFTHDIGAFQIGLGAVLLLGAFLADALLATLAGVAVAAAAHLVSHVIDRELGGTPASDIPFFAVLAVALAAAAASRAGTARRR